MADLDFTVSADTSRAQRALQDLDNKIDGLNGSFGKLKAAIAGIAIGSFIQNAAAMADRIVDIKNATGIATESVLGFANALERNGGAFEAAGEGLFKFNDAIARAADGNAQAQESFAKLGVTLQDLRTLSEQELLAKVIQGLGNVTDNSQRAALGMDLFGKAAKGTDWVGVAGSIDSLTRANRDNAEVTERVSEMIGRMEVVYRQLQYAVLNALDPLFRFLEAVTRNETQLKILIDTLINVGTALAGLYVVSKVVSGFQLLAAALASSTNASTAATASKTALTAATSSLGIASTATATKMTLLTAATTSVGKAAAAAATLFGTAMAGIAAAVSRVIPIIAGLVLAYEGLNAIVKLISNAFGKGDMGIKDWAEEAAKAVGLINQTSREAQAEIERETRLIEQRAEAAKTDAKTQEEIRQVQDSQEKERLAALKREAEELERKRKAEEEAAARREEAFQRELGWLQRNLDYYKLGNIEQERRLQNDIALIGKTQEQKEVIQAKFDLESKYLSEIQRLLDDYNEKSKSGKEEDLRMLPEIQRALQEVSAAYENQLGIVTKLTTERQRALEAERQSLAINDFMTKSQIDNAKKIRSVQDEISKSTMTDIERKYYDISRAAEESARSAIEQENARRRAAGVAAMSAEEEQKYYNQAKKNAQELTEVTQKQIENSRSFETGWQRAYRQYQEDAGNAAKTAEDLFKKSTQGIEDALVGFAKTGKFEWKGLISSIGETILRSSIRQIFANQMQGMTNDAQTATMGITSIFQNFSGGLGSIFNGLGSFISNAFSGILGSVGNIGSSLGNAVSGIINSVGSAIGGRSSGGGFGGLLNDVVTGIGGTISDLFDGFFANGGRIGAGKFGVVGERGPELVTGPANVTPMQPQQNVIYNINAVDALSFKQMIAADPSFIHGVAMMGARAAPARR